MMGVGGMGGTGGGMSEGCVRDIHVERERESVGERDVFV